MSVEQHKDNGYEAEQIQVLEGLEAVRKRPGMYIGSTGPKGLHHLVYEIVDNAIDEAIAGYCSEIDVEILEGEQIRVRDNGRGIPVGIQPKMGIPAVTVVFTVLHAGGKFGNGGYKISSGLHGVGASVVNALSTWLEVEVRDGEKIYKQRFERGKAVTELELIGETKETGTMVTFLADPTVFEETVYDFETLQTRLREQAFLNAGVCINLTDLRKGKDHTTHRMHYEGGVASFVEFINKRKGAEVLHDQVIFLSAAEGSSTAEIAMQYTDSYNELLLSFANCVHTVEGGTHEMGLSLIHIWKGPYLFLLSGFFLFLFLLGFLFCLRLLLLCFFRLVRCFGRLLQVLLLRYKHAHLCKGGTEHAKQPLLRQADDFEIRILPVNAQLDAASLNGGFHGSSSLNHFTHC